ncbi:hypothetical protein [Clostridium senegalense]|uniref:Mg2+ and Co2+ transporter CorB n=1 Tax=Clostridium senegalense TaxID=1465809 RepID=A0A6M0H6V6_9CLOT|nr:hypothetical protein [Clostridium senegalense]NEU06034.1 hypothetical protein [Clostridium senegalense]
MGTSNKNKNSKQENGERRWLITIVITTFVISGTVSLISESTLSKVNILVALAILFGIILLGVVFDIVGTAVTAGDETPFHSMASKRVPEAKIVVKLIRNASKVSNFCNDVIGDVAGIISGSVGVVIVSKILQAKPNLNQILIAATISAVIAAMTVGGKAMGKKVAISKSNDILFSVSKIIYFFQLIGKGKNPFKNKKIDIKNKKQLIQK